MKYKVTMTCPQVVSTSVVVEANNRYAACILAKDSIQDCVWSVIDFDEGCLEIEDCERLED
jgi:hypothetical protein